MANRIVYCVCDDDCRFESMTKEQILTAIEQAISQGHVSDPDSAVFSKIKEIRANEAIQIWTGTEAQFNALDPAPSVGKAVVRVGADGVLYLCNDDTTFDLLNEIAERGLPIEMGGTKAKTAEEARKNLDVPSNAEMHQRDRVVNLLDNSDFTHPVNQRGETSYSAAGYAIDRWRLENNAGTLAINDGYITLSASGGQCWFTQKFERYLTVGQIYTLYVELADDTIHARKFTVLDSQSSSDAGWGILVYQKEKVSLVLNAGNTKNICRVALYEGEYTVDTVPTYQPNGYARELAECRRYYENSWYPNKREDVVNNQMMAVCVYQQHIDAFVDFRSTKRIVPTITLHPRNTTESKWVYYTGSAYSEINSAEIMTRLGNNGFFARLTKRSDDSTVISNNNAYAVDGHWEATADL